MNLLGYHFKNPLRLAALAMGVLVTLSLPGFTQNKFSIAAYYNCTHERAVMNAFDLMAASSGEQSLSVILNKPIRVIFKDLKTLDKRVKNYDALSYMTGNGQLIIYINEKHANAPAEALASILSHEAMHNDPTNSMSEEVAGWMQEAKVWHEMKQQKPQLAVIPKGEYPLVDRLNTLEVQYVKNTMNDFVRKQPGYQGLPEHSPGF